MDKRPLQFSIFVILAMVAAFVYWKAIIGGVSALLGVLTEWPIQRRDQPDARLHIVREERAP